jgi:hypothetical protein
LTGDVLAVLGELEYDDDDELAGPFGDRSNATGVIGPFGIVIDEDIVDVAEEFLGSEGRARRMTR